MVFMGQPEIMVQPAKGEWTEARDQVVFYIIAPTSYSRMYKEPSAACVTQVMGCLRLDYGGLGMIC